MEHMNEKKECDKQRNNNTSPLRIMGQNDPSRKITPKRDQINPQGPAFGLKRQSPKPKNYSPSSRYISYIESDLMNIVLQTLQVQLLIIINQVLQVRLQLLEKAL